MICLQGALLRSLLHLPIKGAEFERVDVMSPPAQLMYSVGRQMHVYQDNDIGICIFICIYLYIYICMYGLVPPVDPKA